LLIAAYRSFVKNFWSLLRETGQLPCCLRTAYETQWLSDAIRTHMMRAGYQDLARHASHTVTLSLSVSPLSSVPHGPALLRLIDNQGLQERARGIGEGLRLPSAFADCSSALQSPSCPTLPKRPACITVRVCARYTWCTCCSQAGREWGREWTGLVGGYTEGTQRVHRGYTASYNVGGCAGR